MDRCQEDFKYEQNNHLGYWMGLLISVSCSNDNNDKAHNTKTESYDWKR